MKNILVRWLVYAGLVVAGCSPIIMRTHEVETFLMRRAEEMEGNGQSESVPEGQGGRLGALRSRMVGYMGGLYEDEVKAGELQIHGGGSAQQAALLRVEAALRSALVEVVGAELELSGVRLLLQKRIAEVGEALEGEAVY